ncbi:hypothetical protein Calkro_1011 [Caldicellulosiruptor kronotskyensis 2002]|uniref:Lipoprotein n=1 Tax=Caldicellulosiruptor kronotskyensis (strain DSM 18902 / VKM B-2412 / 2002) TaxID=632348 RepID=E4SBA0_CALK2|nr:hypothetical protein [Caldicellulosiruptor kronotskyensis]ADQ45882.1 hypothetical protein Calkro_1011 [Caldicellulosiruptor kronotskyensis 2002]
MKVNKTFTFFCITAIACLSFLLFLVQQFSDEKIPLGLLLILFSLLMAQAVYIFFDAKNRGEKYYFLWGLFGLLNFPSSLIIYLLITRVILKDKNRKTY